MVGSDSPRMMFVVPHYDGSRKSYGSDIMLMVRARNPRVTCEKEST